MFDVHQMQVFLAVAEKLSFTRAAETLFLTQSAVSHQVAKLERSVGRELLLREGRTVSLTAAGREMSAQARRVLAVLEEADTAVKMVGEPGRGRLRIGAPASSCQYLFPEALREFRECFPDYTLSIIPGDAPVTVQHLLAQTIDLAVMVRPERQNKLTYFDLFEDELQFLVNPLHPWAVAGKVDRRQLGEQPLVLYGQQSASHRLVERYFLKQGVPLRDPIELGDIGAIKELVKLGLGVSLTAGWVARPEVAEGSLVLLPVPGARLKRQWCMASLAGRRLSVAEQTLVGLCQTVAQQLATG